MMIRRSAFLPLVGLMAFLVVAFGTALEASDDRLAIKGYDPVAYFTKSKPMEGDPQFEYEWDGAVYRFASSEHLDLFKADPEKYAPLYRGFCTASLARGVRYVADPEHWLIHEGLLHIFGKPIGPGLMTKDAVAMKQKADENYKRVSALPIATPAQPKQ